MCISVVNKQLALIASCLALLVMLPAQADAQGLFIRADCNQDLQLNIADPLTLLNKLFGENRPVACDDACDSNDSETLDISDAVNTLNFLFRPNSSAPPPPYPSEGVDPPNDPPLPVGLTCANGKNPPNRILVSPSNVFFEELGQRLVLQVLAEHFDGTLEHIRTSPTTSYSTSNANVVDVDDEGRLTASGIGEATVRILWRTVSRDVPVTVFVGADGSPVVTINVPPNSSVVTGDRVLVAGIVSDPNASLEIVTDALPSQPLPVQNGAFRTIVDLENGPNFINVMAMNPQGTGVATVTVTRTALGEPDAIGPDGDPLPTLPITDIGDLDQVPPAVIITEPTNGAQFCTGRVLVRGTVSDPSATVEVNGVQTLVDGTDFRVTLSLSAGPHSLVAEGIDPTGNRSSAQVSIVVYSTSVAVTVTSPANRPTIVTGDGNLALEGAVFPANADVLVDGTPATVVGNMWQANLALSDGVHDLVVTASRELGGFEKRAATVRSVIVDLTPPRVELLCPPAPLLLSPEGYTITASAVRISGRVFDRGGAPRDEDTPPTVTVQGVPASVDGDTFSVQLGVAVGLNVFQLEATDSRGNVETIQLRIVRRFGGLSRVIVLGDEYRTVPPGQRTALPLEVQVANMQGESLSNVPVIFELTAGDGSFDDGNRLREVQTDSNGRASIFLDVGLQRGAASHVVTVRAPSVANMPRGFVFNVGPSSSRVLVFRRAGDLLGPAGKAPFRPLEVRLLDNAGNEIAGQNVIFRVIEGGATVDGGIITSATTDARGVVGVSVELPTGTESTSTIQVTHPGAAPVRTIARGVTTALNGETVIVGSVTDPRGQPISTQVRIVGWPAVPELETVSDSIGAFRLSGVPAGDVLLQVDSDDEHAGTTRHVVTFEGHAVAVGAIRLAPLNDGLLHRLVRLVPGSGATVVLPPRPGFEAIVAPDSVTFLGGATEGFVSFAAPHLTAIPAPAPNGIHPLGLFGIFPVGVRFDPPPELKIPNLDGRVGELLSLFEYRAATGGFVELTGGVVKNGGRSVQLDSLAEVTRGGVYFLARRGPREAAQGTLTGEAGFVRSGRGEVEQHRRSAELGFQVYAHSGELFVDETDLEIRGRGLDYRFRRRYESRHHFGGALGRNWEHEYEDRRLYPSFTTDNIVRASGDGYFDEFLFDAFGGGFVSPVGVFSRLFEEGGFLIERTPDGLRYRYFPLDGSLLAGRLESIADASGNQLQFQRGAEGLIDTVVDSLGRTITYMHDANGRIESVTDFNGRQIVFSYDLRGNLVAVTSPAVIGTVTNNDFPTGKRVEYVYSSGFADDRLNHNLMQIIDPREAMANKIPRVSVTYGEDPADAEAFDRVISQVWGGTNTTGVAAGGTVAFTYEFLRPRDVDGENAVFETADELEEHLLSALGRTSIVDRRGLSTSIVYSGAGLPLQKNLQASAALDSVRPRDPVTLHPEPGVSPPEYVTRWTWTREGLLASETRARGDRLVYTYDESAAVRYAQQALLRTDHFPVSGFQSATGSTLPATTTYRRDPLFGQVVEVISPGGNAPGEVATEFTTVNILDYQEGATIEELAGEAGCRVSDLSQALAAAAIGLGIGDSNDDGIVDQRSGRNVRTTHPPIPRSDGFVQSFVDLRTYNEFGQLTSVRDGDGRVVSFEYHPEADPDGDGVVAPGGGGLEPTTGGYLAREFVDLGSELVETSFLYDAVGNVTQVNDPNGNVMNYAYNALDQIVEEGLPPPLRYRRRYLYDADDNLIEIHLENFSSSDSGVPFVVTANQWLESTAKYDLLGQPVSVEREIFGGEDAQFETTTVELRYDAVGQLVRASTSNSDTVRTWVYDEQGFEIQRTVGANTSGAATFSTRRDEAGNPVVFTDAEDSDGDTNPESRLLRYDGLGRVVLEQDALTGLRILERDIEGRMISEAFFGETGGSNLPATTDAIELNQRGKVLLKRCRWTYDARGKVHEIRSELFGALNEDRTTATSSTLERFWYDAQGRTINQEDARGRLAEWQYDGAGRLVFHKATNGEISRLTLDLNGNPIREVREGITDEIMVDPALHDPDYDEEGRFKETSTIVRIFDGLNRLRVLIDPSGGVWRCRYDSAGNIVFVADTVGASLNPATDSEIAPHVDLLDAAQLGMLNAFGNRIRYTYDNLGRMVRSAHELRRNGNGASQIDTTAAFNVDGIITSILERDGDGRLTAWTDDDGRRVELAYDTAGYPTSKTWSDARTETYERDRDGHLHTLTDANGSRFIQQLDALHRVTDRLVEPAVGLAGTTVQRFEYDSLSRLTLAYDNNDPSTNDDDALATFRYDSFGNVVEESAQGRTILSGYGLDRRLNWRRYPNGRLLEVARDGNGRTTQMTEDARLLATYSHFGSGALLEKNYFNGARLSYVSPDVDSIIRKSGYDMSGGIVEQTYVDSTAALLMGFEYGRNRLGHTEYERAVHGSGNIGDVWRYDSVYRLAKFFPDVFNPSSPQAEPPARIEFFPDGAHNWRFLEVDAAFITLTVSADRNQLIQSDSESFFYTPGGYLLAQGLIAFSYDAFGRVRAVTRSGATVSTHTYDAFDNHDGEHFRGRGRRVTKEVFIAVNFRQPLGVVEFVHAGDELIEERQLNALRQYFWEDAGDSSNGSDRRPGFRIVQSDTAPSERVGLLHSAADSVVGLVDDTGGLIESFDFGSYGQPTVMNRFGLTVPFPDSQNVILYGSQYHDFELGLHLVGARHFDPQLGRFLIEDDALMPDGPLAFNRYLAPQLRGLPGEIVGSGSARSQAGWLAPLRVGVKASHPALPGYAGLRNAADVRKLLPTLYPWTADSSELRARQMPRESR